MKIIFVDDDEDTANLFGILFEMLGHEVQVAYSGASGLYLMRKFKPDVAVLDLLMPLMTGCQMAYRLRELVPAIGLVAMTGMTAQKWRDDAKEAHFSSYMLKPVNTFALEKAMRDSYC